MKKIYFANLNFIKLSIVLKICKELDIEAVNVESKDYHIAIGHFFDSKISAKPLKDDLNSPGEILIFAGIDSNLMDEFLKKYNSENVPKIPLKAVLTPTNCKWSLSYLFRELNKESASFSTGK